jgi:hypothetical protein
MATDLTIAKTILAQIKMIDPRATWAWGAKDFVGTANSIRFKTSGMVKWKGYVEVSLNGRDLYDVEFYRVRGIEVKVVSKLNDIFAEDLVNVIDEQVG